MFHTPFLAKKWGDDILQKVPYQSGNDPAMVQSNAAKEEKALPVTVKRRPVGGLAF
jgi:hypothetical protein